MINQKITKNKLDKRSKYLRSLICKILLSTDRGHFGSAMSLVEILRVLYDEIIFFDSIKPQNDKRDRVILSKGHGCLALYAILADKGFFPMKELEKAFSKNALLGGHPENHIPGVEVSTGALGHGFSLAVGMAKAAKIKKKNHKIYVIVGDGELNEGANWEAALSASQNKLGNLKVVVDCKEVTAALRRKVRQIIAVGARLLVRAALAASRVAVLRGAPPDVLAVAITFIARTGSID